MNPPAAAKFDGPKTAGRLISGALATRRCLPTAVILFLRLPNFLNMGLRPTPDGLKQFH